MTPAYAAAYRDADGAALPGIGTAITRAHCTDGWPGTWLSRDDALLPDGTWRVGVPTLGMIEIEAGTMTLDEADSLASRLAGLVRLARQADLYATQEGRDAPAADLTEAHGRPVTVTEATR
ncbi:MAG: hypothetical protein U0R68_13385 [Candidatus Nanopelagicales bacterium]